MLLVPLSFVSDHIETLYEVDQLFAGDARRAGITDYRRPEALNTIRSSSSRWRSRSSAISRRRHDARGGRGRRRRRPRDRLRAETRGHRGRPT